MSSKPDPELRRVAGQCLARKVRQASRHLTALYDEALRPHGLKASQLNVLVAVGAFGTAGPAQLVRALDLEKSTVSRGAERLAASGWLEVLADPAERGLRYRLTAKGRALLARALPDWERAEAEARRRLGREGVAALSALAGALEPRA